MPRQKAGQNRRELHDALTKVEPQGRKNRLDISQLAAPKLDNSKATAIKYGYAKVGIRILMARQAKAQETNSLPSAH